MVCDFSCKHPKKVHIVRAIQLGATRKAIKEPLHQRWNYYSQCCACDWANESELDSKLVRGACCMFIGLFWPSQHGETPAQEVFWKCLEGHGVRACAWQKKTESLFTWQCFRRNCSFQPIASGKVQLRSWKARDISGIIGWWIYTSNFGQSLWFGWIGDHWIKAMGRLSNVFG